LTKRQINSIVGDIMEEQIEEITMLALNKARKAFNKFLEDNYYDPGYWDIRFTAWELSSDSFQRLRRYEIEEECKDAYKRID